MTAADRKELGRYVRYLADEAGLRDWRIDLFVEPFDESENDEHGDGPLAKCHSVYGRRVMVLRIDQGCRDWKRPILRHAAVHELVHAHLDPMRQMVIDDLSGQLSESAHSIFREGFHRHLEHAVDAVSDALSRKLPLICWP